MPIERNMPENPNLDRERLINRIPFTSPNPSAFGFKNEKIVKKSVIENTGRISERLVNSIKKSPDAINIAGYMYLFGNLFSLIST